jgi:hypothetical protein
LGPQRVDYPTLLDEETFKLLAYPLENVAPDTPAAVGGISYPHRPLGLPERFSEVVHGVVEIVDGVHEERVLRWHPAERRWERTQAGREV